MATVSASPARRSQLSGPLSAELLLSGSVTQGRFSLVEHVLRPRALGSPMHTHRREDEFSVVLEGRIGAQIGSEVVTAEAGAVLVKPRGVPHAFWNPTDSPARLLEVISPAGFEEYFSELAAVLATPGPPDVRLLGAIAERYDLDLDQSSIARLAADHGLDLGGRSLGGSTPERWNALYAGTPPWETGRPQPAFAALAASGALTGRILDVGCGTGENALAVAEHGADVTGIDIAPRAVDGARKKATARGLAARFLVGDVLHLQRLGEQFDGVLDSGTFHVFADADRSRYVASLAAAVRPGGRCFLLCFSDRTPGDWGPRRISGSEVRAAFSSGWTVEAIEPSVFELPDGNPLGHASAWLVTVRRSA